MRTLLLTPWMSPHRIISWERAVVLLVLGKVDVISAYEDEVRGPSHALPTPSIVRMKKGGPRNKPVVRFSRVNVFTRDGFRCQYCGERLPVRELNYDHVVPRSKGGKTTWENIVTSCYPCNLRKGSRTPEEAGMTLAKRPVVPKSLPVASGLRFTTRDVPETWAPYCQGLLGKAVVS
jgi:5-methylcytosine-specific restriction endonuclease McrA